MTTTLNILPKDNPIAIRIPIDTAINNISLDPKETYNVVLPALICNRARMNDAFKYTNLFTVGTKSGEFYIKLYDEFALKIYLPSFDGGQTIYLVPCIFNASYKDGLKDMVSLNELNTNYRANYGFANITSWSHSLEYWLYNINGYNSARTTNKPTRTTVMKQDILFSISGVDTNRSDKTKTISITLQSLAKILGT